MQAVLDVLLDEGDSWKLGASLKACEAKGYNRPGEGGRLDVKVTGVAPRRLASLCATLLHPELYPSWIPGCNKAALLHKPSRFRMLVYLKLDTVWPVAARDAVILGYGDLYGGDSVRTAPLAAQPVTPHACRRQR